jgi:hypothetical protein
LVTAHGLRAAAEATQAADALAAIPDPLDSEADLLLEGKMRRGADGVHVRSIEEAV